MVGLLRARTSGKGSGQVWQVMFVELKVDVEVDESFRFATTRRSMSRLQDHLDYGLTLGRSFRRVM